MPKDATAKTSRRDRGGGDSGAAVPSSSSSRRTKRTGQFGGTFGYREPFNVDGDTADDDDEDDIIDETASASTTEASGGRGSKRTRAAVAAKKSKNGKNRTPESFESGDDDEAEDDEESESDADDDDERDRNSSRRGRNLKRGSARSKHAKQQTKKRAAGRSSDEDEDVESDDASTSSLDGRKPRRRPERKRGNYASKGNGTNGTKGSSLARRTSSRANKFTASMAEPSANVGTTGAATAYYESPDDDDRIDAGRKHRGGRGDGAAAKSATSSSVLVKSPAKRHAKQRLSIRSDTYQSSNEDDDDDVVVDSAWDRKGGKPKGPKRSSEEDDADADREESSEGEDEDEEEDEGGIDEEPLKLGRIIASRTETRAKWREICQAIQTSEIDNGSRWHQPPMMPSDDGSDNQVFEERFLVKWRDLSYLHCSWETQTDLESQLEQAKPALAHFFRKSVNGLLYGSDERCDGDYFDPGWVQIDRILEVHLAEDREDVPDMTPEAEDTFTPKDFGIVLDKSDERYEEGTGRQFLIKWSNLGYAESTYEFERDLILNDVEYKSHLKSFLARSTKPHRSEVKDRTKKGEALRRQLYKTFGDNSPIAESKRDKEVEKFKGDLLSEVHKNGGQLRDYQAEGVAWMISNYINKRGFILADEMGLGKTLQTATFVNFIKSKVHRVNPVLVIAPLSTLTHWRREFEAWTDLNVVVYHGSADDRKQIRENDFVYECDRPSGGVAFNQTYLKKCLPKRSDDASSSPWMVQVVITTPEMITSEDSSELAAVPWEIVVCDEAHRMKNNNSKLTTRMKDGAFKFNHKVLLTGTPIQNDVTEFWTLLNFIDPVEFDALDNFLEEYGDLKTKESIDNLHEQIRPFILRRLKEDVETSVPPKEETLIEVELTADQKKYYRALYEKNVGFLYKNKRSAIDGPSLLNLAMQLRKCCNHLFLLNGVEPEFRASLASNQERLTDGDILVRASGKLVLLDKLLPRLQQEGHRVLIFSQFKMMLDVLEDYLHEREMRFERIDGSITGHKRQQAIDRFQAPPVEGKQSPFIMLLSTRAGGVGINLTAADTVVVFDSDFNPQNDLQAQARCHRIGQTKSVKVYRLMSSKTYEMQLFHMSSMKLGLDQAVLRGFESGSAEGALSKDEVEKLLRHGAYDIFNEEKAGSGDAESNAFVQQDIDTILERRSRTIVQENTGSQSNAGGGTFSKASFKIAKSPGAPEASTTGEDIDVEDPDFWKKMLGEPKVEDKVELDKTSRRKVLTNYNENLFLQRLSQGPSISDPGSSSYESDSSDGDELVERSRWGGKAIKNEWAKDDAESLVKSLCRFGYRVLGREAVPDWSSSAKEFSKQEMERMAFSLCLVAVLETYEDELQRYEKALEKRSDGADSEKQRSISDRNLSDGAKGTVETDGDVDVAQIQRTEGTLPKKISASEEDAKQVFEKIVQANSAWLSSVVDDAVAYAQKSQPRADDVIERVVHSDRWKQRPNKDADAASSFAQAWQSLKNRGWKAETPTTGDNAGKTRYEFEGKNYTSVSAVLNAAKAAHPDLASMCDNILAMQESSKLEAVESTNKQRADHLGLRLDNISPEKLSSFVERYSPLQLVAERVRSKHNRLKLRKVVDSCCLMSSISTLVEHTNASAADSESLKKLEVALQIDKRSALPHPSWTSRHDAILILAILRHGWIDQSSSFRAIADDTSIRWGPPFELQDDQAPLSPPVILDDVEGLRATAARAAAFISKNRELIEEFKIDQPAVVRAYGLMLSTESDKESNGSAEKEQSQSHGWVVDDSVLVAETKRDLVQQPQDLPTAKDLLRRAKLLLSRSGGAGRGAVSEPLKAVPHEVHDFAVLDQSDRCNIYLAELLRGLLKAKSGSKDTRKLCVIASQEATERMKAIEELMLRRPSEKNRLSKALKDMLKIGQHLKVVLESLAKSVRQFKNVIRAMLGLDLDPGRNPKEPMFPEVKAKPSTSLAKKIGKRSNESTSVESSPKRGGTANVMEGKAKGTTKTGYYPQIVSRSPPANFKTAGEIAIENSQGKLWTRRSQGGPFLQLTEIEIRIISVACSKGLPVWKDKFNGVVTGGGVGPSSPAGRGRPYALTWVEFGRHVSEHAKTMLEQQKAKVNRIEDDIASRSSSQLNSQVRYRLRVEESTRDVRQRAFDQAEDYASEPETLAKKTVMMVAKVLEMAVDPPISTANPAREKAGMVKWLRSDLRRWGKSLDVSDDSGDPFPLTAVDFEDDVGEEERAAIEVTSVLSVEGCRNVVEQVALLSRLRSVFLKCERGAKQRILEGAVESINDSSKRWESQPHWWGSREDKQEPTTLHHDQLLLERLMHSGFDGVLLDSKSYGVGGDVSAANVNFKYVGLTTAALQERAYQLVRELHVLEASGTFAANGGGGGTSSSPSGGSSSPHSPVRAAPLPSSAKRQRLPDIKSAPVADAAPDSDSDEVQVVSVSVKHRTTGTPQEVILLDSDDDNDAVDVAPGKAKSSSGSTVPLNDAKKRKSSGEGNDDQPSADASDVVAATVASEGVAPPSDSKKPRAS